MSVSNEIQENLIELQGNLDQQVVEDSSAEDHQVPLVQYDINSYGADYDVEGLVKRLDRGDIVIPPFQRNFVWTQKEASRFIESLLLGLPVPGIFLVRESESNKLLVIDGQQRLKTLQFFYNGFFNPKDEDQKKQIFKLLEVQPKFEGLVFDKLEEQDKIKLNDSLIHATIIKQESPKEDDTSIYHIFDRLNSEGRRLTPQEIRTAIYHGKYIGHIKKLNDYKNWRIIYGKKNARLKDQELILRFLAFWFERNNYERPMNEFLNKFSRRHQNANDEFLSNTEKIFVETIDLVCTSIGKKAFRPISAINAAVFDSVMIGLALRISKGVIEDTSKVKEIYDQLIADHEYSDLVSQSTSDEKNVSARISKAIEKFQEI